MMQQQSMSMMLKALKILPREDLDRLAKSCGLAPVDRTHRLDIEYALVADERQAEIARVVGLMIYRALKREAYESKRRQ